MNNLGALINPAKDQEKIAIIDSTGRATYRELENMSNHVANDLRSKGFGVGDRIGLLGKNSVSYVAVYLGILKLGAVAVLINAKLPAGQVDYIVKDSNVKFLWQDPDIPKTVQASFEPCAVQEDDPAIIMYTSGSTSVPKGVVLAHRHKWIIKQKSGYPGAEKRRAIVAAPMYHMNGLSNTEAVLCGHGTLVLLPSFEPKEFLLRISFHKVNAITSVPTMLAMMLKETDLIKELDLSSVKLVSMASAPVSKQLFAQLKTTFPQATISNNYGITEVSPGMFGRHPTLPTPDMSVGYPMQGIDYRIVNGILQVRSPAMFLKYNNVNLNNITEDGYFNTNDLFRVDENGFYFFLGRADDMFVCGGHNVYPRQIEDVLENNPLVKSAAVIGIEDEVKGVKPYAFVVGEANEEQLKDWALQYLPASHCPRRIWILDSMPLTSVNKVDKNLLAMQAKHLLENGNNIQRQSASTE